MQNQLKKEQKGLPIVSFVKKMLFIILILKTISRGSYDLNVLVVRSPTVRVWYRET